MEEPKTINSKKRQTWKHDEVSYMLMLLEKYNFNWQTMDTAQIARYLLAPMAQMHFYRTAYQISMKLKSLKKRYILSQQEKQEMSPELNSSDEVPPRTPLIVENPFGDSCIWTREEIQKMFDIIKELKLENEITLTFFSPIALRLIATSLQTAGYPRNINQVNQILMSFKSTYIDFKVAVENGENPQKCEYHLYLDQFWSQDFAKCRLSGGKTNSERNDFWSKNETTILLSAIEEQELEEEAFKNSLPTAYKLQKILEENGFSKSAVQIMNHLEYLKQSFLNGNLINSEQDVLNQFSFYHRYKSIFEHCFEPDATELCSVEITGHQDNEDTKENKDDVEITGEDKTINNVFTTQKAKRDRGMLWSTEEICTLLDCVRDLRLEPELKNRFCTKTVAKLVQPLSNCGFQRTDAQIKHKLKSLKRFYQQCCQKGNSILVDCPFYNKLCNIFQDPISEARLASIQKLLPPDITVDVKSDRYFDHSYRVQLEDKLTKLNKPPEDTNISQVINLEQKTVTPIKEETANSPVIYGGEEYVPSLDISSESKVDCAESHYTSNGSINLVPIDLLCPKHKADDDQLGPLPKKSKTILSNSLDENLTLDTSEETNIAGSLKSMLSDWLENQKTLQEQHHKWMEEQFEIQRKHDRVQRAALLNEIKEFRREVTNILSQDYFEDPFEESY